MPSRAPRPRRPAWVSVGAERRPLRPPTAGAEERAPRGRRQRKLYQNGRLPADRLAVLDGLGFLWLSPHAHTVAKAALIYAYSFTIFLDEKHRFWGLLMRLL